MIDGDDEIVIAAVQSYHLCLTDPRIGGVIIVNFAQRQFHELSRQYNILHRILIVLSLIVMEFFTNILSVIIYLLMIVTFHEKTKSVM